MGTITEFSSSPTLENNYLMSSAMIRRHHHIARTSDSLLNPLRLWYSFLMSLPTLFLLEMATSACCSVIHSRLTEICSYLMECHVILSFHGPRRMHHDDFGDGMTFHLADLSKFDLSNEVYQLGTKVLVGWIWWRLGVDIFSFDCVSWQLFGGFLGNLVQTFLWSTVWILIYLVSPLSFPPAPPSTF